MSARAGVSGCLPQRDRLYSALSVGDKAYVVAGPTQQHSHAAQAEPWRTMSAEDALAYLAAEDAAQRTLEGRAEAYARRLGGYANRRRLVAWRRENGLCPKCGRARRADDPEFKHCRICRKAFREHQRHLNANLTEPQRLARNERARRSYHKLAHGKAPPPKAVTGEVPVVTPMVTPTITGGPKRDRAEYMRQYRLNHAKA